MLNDILMLPVDGSPFLIEWRKKNETVYLDRNNWSKGGGGGGLWKKENVLIKISGGGGGGCFGPPPQISATNGPIDLKIGSRKTSQVEYKKIYKTFFDFFFFFFLLKPQDSFGKNYKTLSWSSESEAHIRKHW